MEKRKEILNQFYLEVCDEEERLQSQSGSVEFLTTTHYIQKYLFDGARILEVGAGTGRFSLYYAGQGYSVNAIEYVESNLEKLKSKITSDMNIIAEQGDAVDLSGFQGNTFDITLVLGPLYHLYEKEKQEKAIEEAIRVTKKNGIIAIAYLASDSIIIDWALRDHHLIDGYGKDFDENFKIVNYPEGVFAAFYIQEFKDMMKKFPVSMEHNVAADGMTRHMREQIEELSEKEFDMWMKYHLSACEREELQGYSNHLLYICRKTK